MRVVPLVEVVGSPYEQGRAHGEMLCDGVHRVLDRLACDVQTQYDLTFDAFSHRFTSEFGFRESAERWVPFVLDEVRGIADAVKRPFEHVLCLNLMDEYWVHRLGPVHQSCSSLGLAPRPGEPTWIAQNMDLPTLYDGLQTLVRSTGDPDRPDRLVLTFPGYVGLTGYNEAGVGVCCNTLSQLARSRHGLPVSFVVRGILNQRNASDAVAFAQSVPHAAGQNYLIGDPTTVIDIECSANSVVRFVPDSGPEIVWHTNHPLVNDDLHIGEPDRRPKRATVTTAIDAEANTRRRLESLVARLQGPALQQPIEAVAAALRARDSIEHPVCRHPEDGRGFFTFAAIAMRLSDHAEAQVSFGPPDLNDFATYRLRAQSGTASSRPRPSDRPEISS
ncbi:MAG TPA: C45 family peptidase [Mycobacteriales bacterium]|nr:C45 family peptidase [Mycobacteriales bacterium]